VSGIILYNYLLFAYAIDKYSKSSKSDTGVNTRKRRSMVLEKTIKLNKEYEGG
jgi:hypothetical protein